MSSKTIFSKNDQPGSIIFISHGGGPWPLLNDPRHKNLIEFLEKLPETLISPSAIVVISGHWEEDSPAIQSNPHPEMLYDYYGFPEESYQITYPAPGQPELAAKISDILGKNHIKASLDNERGFDHGLFVPLMLMYPATTIPCLQLSLTSNLDPGEHIQLGKALRELRNENILIIGSGASFHNLRGFREPPTPETIAMNEGFENWLVDVMTNKQFSETEREQKLKNWLDAPGARYCHPREEHLLPLHVCYGVGGGPADRVLSVEYMERTASMYVWSTPN
jgi:4,5-DOPA dioxygenase extradiol